MSRKVQVGGAIAALFGLLATGLVTGAVSNASPAPVGNGFTVTPADLAFILKQIKIAEKHSLAFQSGTNPDPTGDPYYCAALLGPGPDQVPDYLTSYGLRTTSGACNNLIPGRALLSAADVPFPRLTNPDFRPAQDIPAGFPGAGTPTSYADKSQGSIVFDSQPREISNLIVDQSIKNPAAVAAYTAPVRAQAGDIVAPPFPCTDETVDPPTPLGCTRARTTLFIPNVTTDVGLSPPYNSLFTFFGQFFDHGVDQTVKGSGTVFVPLLANDPLRTVGPDGVAGTGDEVPAEAAFIPLSRGQVQPGPDGILGNTDDEQNADNTDSPWVDQSQTYTSHDAHQVFLREYEMNSLGHPVSTGKLLGGIVNDDPLPCAVADCFNDGNATTGSISSWAATKKQAYEKLGLLLQDKDVTNIPMVAADPYGNFIPGPLRGLPQYVTQDPGGPIVLVEGDLANPVPVPANVVYFNTPFLTDIAHNADPSPQDTDHDPNTPPVAPTPDADNEANSNFMAQLPGTYDDELLNDHAACGDGRCNENIALTTIHQVFHHEHDRLVDYIKGVLLNDTSVTGVAALPEWQLPTDQSPDGWNGSRLFQAARFVTEMEYQHLVFEEFARKLVPAIRPFHVYSPDLNPAVVAEFAHAVYRLGHSMLDDDVARCSINQATGDCIPGGDNSITLLHAFLNPPELYNPAGVCDVAPCFGATPLTPEQGAGSVVMGSSDQVGNEMDEFINNTLRNNLLGLPLDLATFNLTRARSEGVPRLNDVRRQIFAQTNDGQLAPYTNWADYGNHLKHPESLINFVAAYGQHPSILGATSVDDKRAAARAIVDPLPTDTPPADAADFMFGTGAWADVNGKTTTGLDDVDLWVGGLAEVTNLFGGLLGSTFNYVFQGQLERLQDGDRFYYLFRTPGMNLRSQLEGNSFSELIMRNTDGTSTLKADAFATADCKFQIANLGSFAVNGTSVPDDPNTPDCDEHLLLTRSPDGTIAYKQRNTVDPAGINGQSVYNGTPGVDRIKGGNDNDTFWGNAGNDIIDGQGGDDVMLGGDGNDILTDLDGADVLKGGPGNDAIDGGPGDDIPIGGDGQDFLNGGANDNETFAGPGNDFIIAGQGADAVFGDSGDDWIEGGSGQDLLQGDHGAPFFDDPGQTAPGNDIFVGQVGENDYDTEGGDDIMAQNAAIDRNAGAAGFDWAIHQYDTVGGDDDLMINQMLFGIPIQLVVNRDRWQETEADTGSNFDDIIRGDDLERIVGPAGFQGCDALDPAGIARINGLNRFVTTFPTLLADVIDASAMKACPLRGAGGTPGDIRSGNVWAEGNILMGGGGNDLIEGRGNDDIIDGDHAVNVHITVRTDPADPATEIGRTDLMEGMPTSGNFGANVPAGMTLQQAVFAGLVDPGNLAAVREVVNPDGSLIGASADRALASDCPAATSDAATTGVLGSQTVKVVPGVTLNCDTAAYLSETLVADPVTGAFDPTTAYSFTHNADGSWTVADLTSVAGGPPFPKGDGIADTLWNIENLRFCVGNDPLSKKCNAFFDMPLADPPAAPLIGVSTPPPGISDIAFGSVATGSTSGTQAITVSNTGNAPLLVTSVTVTGAGASSFSATPDAGCASIAPAGSCIINTTFAPTAVGATGATVTIFHNSGNVPGSTSTVTVSGTGTAPVASITPASLAFGSAQTGTTTAAQIISVTNTGNSALTISAPALGGVNANQFAISGTTCGASVAAGATCTVSVTFAPTTTGAKAATVSITHNSNNVPGTVSSVTLSGTGTAVVVPPGPVASMPANVAFGAQRVNQNKTITVTVLNQGPGALTITGVSTTAGAFTATRGNCPVSLASGRSCKLSVTFRPTVIGQNYTGTLTVTSNASNNPTTATLTGSGKR